MKDLLDKIRKEEVDINNQDLFFSILIKGLLTRLDDDIKIRGSFVPHFILHTGDDTMWLNMKGYNFGIEPTDPSNEHPIYNKIPRCLVNPGSIDLQADQLTSPYSLGNIQYESPDGVWSLTGEFRRIPIKMSCDLKYYVDSYTDLLALIQQVITKLSFIRTYNITYMGQAIMCSYKLPESFSNEHLMDIDGTMSDNKSKTLDLSIEIETSLPVWNNMTIMPNDVRITKTDHRINPTK
jgi:hypothetical protein